MYSQLSEHKPLHILDPYSVGVCKQRIRLKIGFVSKEWI